MTDEIIILPQEPIEIVVQPGSTIGPITSQQIVPLISYTHAQTSPSDQWVVTHNLGFKPNVTVFNSANDIVEGSVIHNSVNQLTLQFSAVMSGTAQLS